jgi:hypothetical protein
VQEYKYTATRSDLHATLCHTTCYTVHGVYSDDRPRTTHTQTPQQMKDTRTQTQTHPRRTASHNNCGTCSLATGFLHSHIHMRAILALRLIRQHTLRAAAHGPSQSQSHGRARRRHCTQAAGARRRAPKPTIQPSGARARACPSAVGVQLHPKQN